MSHKPIDQKLLKTLTILFVEDEDILINSLVPTLNKLFKKVIVARNGIEGLEKLKEHSGDIDVIVSDYNMPILNGMGFLEKIRESDESIPFIFLSAHLQNDILLKCIELNVFHFAPKPVDAKNLLHNISKACTDIHTERLLAHRTKETDVYINIIDKIAIISKTDLKGNITFVNDIFCEVSGYEKDELIGKPHNIVRHPEVPNRTYQNMWDTIKKGEVWKGNIKNLTKTKEDYSVNATIFPIIDDATELVNGYMAVRFLTTDEESKRRAFKSQVMQQVVEFRTVKAGLEEKISALEGENFKLKNTDFIEDKLKQEFDKNKKLNNQLSLYENNLKTNKEIYEKQLFELRDRFVEMEKENRRMKNYIHINKNETNDKDTVISDLTKQIAEIGKYEKKLLHRISELEDVIKHG